MKGLLRININLKVLILGREENRSTRRKTLEAQEKSTTSILSHETHSQDLVSVVTSTTH